MKLQLNDLGLDYAGACHGIQSVKAVELGGSFGDAPMEKYKPKHLRVGIDITKAEMAGLAYLLIKKGLFTLEEYEEAMRLGVNHELAAEEADYGVKFR